MGCGASKVVVEQPGEGKVQESKPVEIVSKPGAPTVVEVGAEAGLDNNGDAALATPLVRRPSTEAPKEKKERPELVFMGDSDDEGNETVPPPPKNPLGGNAKPERPPLVFMGDSDDEGNETEELPAKNSEGDGENKAKKERPPLVFMGDSDDEGNQTEELPSKNPEPGEGQSTAKPERPPLVFMGDSDDEGNATTN